MLTSDWLHNALWSEILPLYRHSPDPERPGYIPDLTTEWTPIPGGPRGLVFHARMLWTAAMLSRAFPNDPRAAELEPHVERGLTALAELFWDARLGGFFWELADDNTPSASSGGKHVYGQAFAIYALAAVGRLGPRHGATAAIDLAMTALNWLERAHDDEHGGYAEDIGLDGRVVETAAGLPTTRAAVEMNVVDTPVGLRTSNTHIHLLEALSELYRATGLPAVRGRLVELLGIVRDRMVRPEGGVPLWYGAGWRPMETATSHGHDLETAYLLIEAAEGLDDPDELARSWATADRLVAHAVGCARDAEHGGVFDSGPRRAPATDTTKAWWVQAESLHAIHLVLGGRPVGVSSLEGELAAVLGSMLGEIAVFVDRHLLDHEHGGWFWSTARDGGDRVETKVSNWKAAYHTSRSLAGILQRGV